MNRDLNSNKIPSSSFYNFIEKKETSMANIISLVVLR